MKVVAGLGNPGPRYRHTRHNVGFEALDAVARRLGWVFDREKYQGLIAQGVYEGERVLLLKPQTYMNLSGVSVAAAARNAMEDFSGLLVVTDDVNLPLGKLRFRPGGSAGGHKGLKSIIERLGGQDFPRLRMGVGDNELRDELTDYVLGRFRPGEESAVEDMIARAAGGILVFLAHGIERAMNEFNG